MNGEDFNCRREPLSLQAPELPQSRKGYTEVNTYSGLPNNWRRETECGERAYQKGYISARWEPLERYVIQTTDNFTSFFGVHKNHILVPGDSNRTWEGRQPPSMRLYIHTATVMSNMKSNNLHLFGVSYFAEISRQEMCD